MSVLSHWYEDFGHVIGEHCTHLHTPPFCCLYYWSHYCLCMCINSDTYNTYVCTHSHVHTEGSAGSAARTTGSLSNLLLAMADSDYQKVKQ